MYFPEYNISLNKVATTLATMTQSQHYGMVRLDESFTSFSSVEVMVASNLAFSKSRSSSSLFNSN